MTLVKVSKALSDKNRLRCLLFLGNGSKNVTQIADELNVEENLASHHLRLLASVGFLKNEKRGREVIYSINQTRLAALFKELFKIPLFKETIEKALKD